MPPRPTGISKREKRREARFFCHSRLRQITPGQTDLGIVCQGNNFFLGLEFAEWSDRAERFLHGDFHAGFDIGKDCRFEKGAAEPVSFAAADNAGAFGDGVLDILLYFFHGCHIDYSIENLYFWYKQRELTDQRLFTSLSMLTTHKSGISALKSGISALGLVLSISIVAAHSYAEPQKMGDTGMILRSNAFENNELIPKKYSCKGEDINPRLTWDNVPEGTKSFALSVKDPDAPMGTFVHWLVYDIEKTTRRIEENSIPGKQVANSFGKEKYGGPCPPSGVHRYYFRLFALDTESLGDIHGMDEFDEKIQEHTLEKAELMGKFAK
jgi:hypothetical protein